MKKLLLKLTFLCGSATNAKSLLQPYSEFDGFRAIALYCENKTIYEPLVSSDTIPALPIISRACLNLLAVTNLVAAQYFPRCYWQ